MRCNLADSSGFTLIELILVISILGILAVAVAPQFVNIRAQAQVVQRDTLAGSIQEGINLQFSMILTNTGLAGYPAALDSAANGLCTEANPCFDVVLHTPVIVDWSKNGLTYTHLDSGTVFTYTPVTGIFK